MENIKVEIWSDIRCPFCYLGKKRFEAALEQFPYRDNVKVEWHSFQLDPYLITQPEKNAYDHLAEVKGITREQSLQAHEQITVQAKEFGLVYNFDKTIVANSFKAHRMIQMAKDFQLGDQMEERLFKAYFTNGENIDDVDTLITIGTEVGLPVQELKEMLLSEEYTDNVLMDESYAREVGIHAVPFFLFNEKISVRGAQLPETFLKALLKTHELVNAEGDNAGKQKSYILRKW